jgi:hypothetical protein
LESAKEKKEKYKIADDSGLALHEDTSGVKNMAHDK